MPRAAILLLAFCLLCSAYAAEREFLQPSSAEGHVAPFEPRCGGPANTIEFAPRESVSVRLWSNPSRSVGVQPTIGARAKWTLTLALSIRYREPLGPPIAVELLAPTIVVTWPDGMTELGPLLPGDARTTILSQQPWRQAWRAFYVPGFDGQELDVQLPALSLDGRRFDFPPIHFRRGSGVFLQPLNC
ncbi:MAG: hypothetical protein ACHQK9_14380 [Reyranellales bacterium]